MKDVFLLTVCSHTFALLWSRKKNCDHRNISIHLPCVCVCLSSRDLFILSVSVSYFFVLSIFWYFPFHLILFSWYKFFCYFLFHVISVKNEIMKEIRVASKGKSQNKMNWKRLKVLLACNDAERWVKSVLILDFKRNIQTWIEIRTLDFQISSLVLYHFSYPHSIDGTGLNFSLESNAMQGMPLSVIV